MILIAQHQNVNKKGSQKESLFYFSPKMHLPFMPIFLLLFGYSFRHILK